MQPVATRRAPLRDDVDRAVIVVALLWLFVLASPFVIVPGILAAFALVRNETWARTGLIVSAALITVIGLVLWAGIVGEPSRGSSVALVLPGVVLLGAALRLRIVQPLPGGDAANAVHDEEPRRPPATTAGDDDALPGYLDAVAHLDAEQMRRLAAAWRAVDPAARQRAWKSVQHHLDATAGNSVLRDVREEVETWSRASSGSPWTWQFGTMTDVDRGNLRRAAMPALVDGAAAVLARDALDPADLDALAGPWLAATDPRLVTEASHAPAEPSTPDTEEHGS